MKKRCIFAIAVLAAFVAGSFTTALLFHQPPGSFERLSWYSGDVNQDCLNWWTPETETSWSGRQIFCIDQPNPFIVMEVRSMLMQLQILKAQLEAVDQRTPYEIQAAALEGTYGGQCVYFVQHFLHQLDDCQEVNCFKKPFRGSAQDIVPNSTTPAPGEAVLTTEGSGHVAVVVAVTGMNIVLVESNMNGDGMVHGGRIMAQDDPRIRGYFDFSR